MNIVLHPARCCDRFCRTIRLPRAASAQVTQLSLKRDTNEEINRKNVRPMHISIQTIPWELQLKTFLLSVKEIIKTWHLPGYFGGGTPAANW